MRERKYEEKFNNRNGRNSLRVEKCLLELTAILKEAWNTAQQTEDRREKIQALSLAKECYTMKLDLLTNATVVDDAIRFVTSNAHRGEDKLMDKLDQLPQGYQ